MDSLSPRGVSAVVCFGADEVDDVDVQVPADRRFRRSVVRPEFEQAVERAAAGSASLYCTS